jgi:hypothetical protein
MQTIIDSSSLMSEGFLNPSLPAVSREAAEIFDLPVKYYPPLFKKIAEKMDALVTRYPSILSSASGVA